MEPMVLIAFLSDTWCTVEPMGGHNGALNGGMMPNDSSRGVECDGLCSSGMPMHHRGCGFIMCSFRVVVSL